MKKIVCPSCGRVMDLTRHGKIAPHKNGARRCVGSGKRLKEKALAHQLKERA